MATKSYCNDVSEELEIWSDKLHQLSSKIDRLSTGEKERMFSQIEGLHILMTEMDDRLCQMLESCSLVEDYKQELDETKVNRMSGQVIGAAEQNQEQLFDYEFGG
jgi:hypothetical protein